MTNFFQTFCVYLKWGIEFLFVTRPPLFLVTSISVLSLLASIVLQRPFTIQLWKRAYWFVIGQFLCLPVTIAIAVIGRVDWQEPHFPGPNRWALIAVNLLSIVSLALGAFSVWKMKGQRWFACSLAFLQVWVLAGAGIVASMSLTGTWL